MHPHGPSCLPGPISRRARKPDKPVPVDAPGVRTELVERIRREIAAGTYDSPAKFQAALARLLDKLEWAE